MSLGMVVIFVLLFIGIVMAIHGLHDMGHNNGDGMATVCGVIVLFLAGICVACRAEYIDTLALEKACIESGKEKIIIVGQPFCKL